LKQIPFANAGLICFRLVALPHVTTAGVSFFWTNFFDGRKVKIVKQKKHHARPARKTGVDSGEVEYNVRLK